MGHWSLHHHTLLKYVTQPWVLQHPRVMLPVSQSRGSCRQQAMKPSDDDAGCGHGHSQHLRPLMGSGRKG